MLDRQTGSGHAVQPKGGRRAAPAQALAAAASQAFDLQAALGVLRCRLVPLVGTIVLVPTFAAIAIHQVTPVYTASGTLIYESNEYKPRELQSILQVGPPTEAVMGSQAEILRSLHVVERVAQQLELFAKPEFNPTLRRAPPLLRLWRGLRGARPAPQSDDVRAAV